MSQEVTTETIDIAGKRIGVVTLTGDEYNSNTVENLSALQRSLSEFDARDGIRGLIVNSGRTGYFANGLSPLYMVDKSLDEKVEVFRVVFRLIQKVLGLQNQIAMEISGHANAAGAMLALAGDYRIMSRTGRFCFSEVKVGMFLPPCLHKIVLKAINPAHLVEAVVHGRAYRADEAKAAGLVNQAVETPADIRPVSAKFFREITRMPAEGVARAKQVINGELIRYMDDHIEADLKLFRDNIGQGHFDDTMAQLAARQRKK